MRRKRDGGKARELAGTQAAVSLIPQVLESSRCKPALAQLQSSTERGNSMRRLSLILTLSICPCILTNSPAFGEYVLKWHIPGDMIPAFASHFGESNGNVEREKATGDLNGDHLPEVLVTVGDELVVLDLATGIQSPAIVTFQGAPEFDNAGWTRVLYMDVDQDHMDEAIVWVRYWTWGLGCIEWVGPSFAHDAGSDPPAHSLRQNAPNPFNPTTTIDFQLQSAGKVNLSIYDVSGRLVRNLADGVLSAGSHKLLWDGLDDSGHELASGTYFYQLRVNGEAVGTQKAAILK